MGCIFSNKPIFVCTDDGSSLCCCWADGCQAETFLRLRETSCQTFFHGHKFSGRAGNRNSRHTIGYQLEKILKKHHRVTIRNHGAVPDLSCLDLTFSFDSDKVFSYSEERLLRFIVLNACHGSILVSSTFPLSLVHFILYRFHV